MWNFEIKEVPAYNKSGTLDEVLDWARYMIPSVFRGDANETELSQIENTGSFTSKGVYEVSVWDSDRSSAAPSQLKALPDSADKTDEEDSEPDEEQSERRKPFVPLDTDAS